jgi:hypothetical protein
VAGRITAAIMAEETLGGLKNLPTNMKCTLFWHVTRLCIDMHGTIMYNVEFA